MDISLRDTLLTPDDILQYQEDPSFGEAFKANVGYLNMPLIDTVVEGSRFATRPKDKNFNVSEAIPEDLLPYYKELYHAKDEEHYRFLEQNLRYSLQRKKTVSEGGILPAVASLPFDPLFFASFLPILNVSLKGKGLLASTGLFAKQGFYYGLASEARRAPFDANQDGEVVTNIASATIFSGALGLGLKGVPALARGVKSSVNKTVGLARGKQPKSFIDEDGNIKFEDGTYTEYDKSKGEYDLTTTDLLPTPTKTVLSDKLIPQSVKKSFYNLAYNSSLTVNRQRKGLGETSVAQMIATHEGTSFRLIDDIDQIYADDIDIRNKGNSVKTDLTADEWWEDTVKRYIEQDNPDPTISGPAINDATDGQKLAFRKIKQFFDSYDQEARFVGLLLDDIQIKKLIKEIDDKEARRTSRLKQIEEDIAKRNSKFNNAKLANLETREIARDGIVDTIEANARKNNGYTRAQLELLDKIEEERLQDLFRRIQIIEDLEKKVKPKTLIETEAKIIEGKGKTVNGRYIPAFFNKQTNTITIDKDFILKDWVNKSWTKPKVKGVNPLPENQFKTPQEWYDFVLRHEALHTKVKRNPKETKASYENRINQLALKEIDEFTGGIPLTASQQKLFDNFALEKKESFKRRIDLEDMLQSPTRKSFRWSIYYDREKLLTEEGKNAFLKMASASYQKQRNLNPNKKYNTSVDEDALSTYKRIMKDGDEEMEADFSGGSKHLRFRKTNFEEWEVEPFILKGKDVIYSYGKRMGGRIEFARKFDNKSVDDILDDIEADMKSANIDEAKIAKTKASFIAEYERATGGLIKNPDRWDNQLAMILKNYSAWVYLPLAGISAIGDLGTVLLQHGLKDSIAGGRQALSNIGYTGAVIKQARFGGDLLESIRGDVQRRLIGDTIKRMQLNRTEKFIAKTNKIYYNVNFLQPITMIGKILDQVLVNDKFYKLSVNYKNLSKFDKEYLARYGITEEDAAYYASMPFEKADNGNFYFANISKWSQTTAKEVEMARKWQSATTAHSNNSVIFGQQFDIPLIANGVVYARDNPFFQGARKLFPNLYKIDTKASTANVKLVRLESQLMTLPFTFMNFAMAANNKILGRIRDPNQQHRLTAVVGLIALSYLALELKKPAWWFKDKDATNLGLRIIDHSGVTGLYGDLGYMGLHMASGAGLYDMEKGFIKGKYAPDGFDSVLEPFGAPPGLIVDYGRSAFDFINGNTSEGTDRLVNSMPFIGLPHIFGDTKAMLKDLGR